MRRCRKVPPLMLSPVIQPVHRPRAFDQLSENGPSCCIAARWQGHSAHNSSPTPAQLWMFARHRCGSSATIEVYATNAKRLARHGRFGVRASLSNSWRTDPQGSDLGRHLSQYWPFRSRRLAVPTISHPNHRAGIVIQAGGEIGFEIGQLLPLQFKLPFEGKVAPTAHLAGVDLLSMTGKARCKAWSSTLSSGAAHFQTTV